MLGVGTCLAEMGKTATMACAINRTGILVRASGIGLMTATSAVLTVDNAAYTYTLLKENDFHWTEESLLSLGETALYAASTVMGIAELGNCIDMERMLEATGMACFPAGTKVLTEEGLKNIEDIKAGDKVYSTNEETGESGYQEVVQTFEKETDVIVHVFYQTDRSTAETDIAETDNEDIAGSERVVTAENADQETIASSEIETTMNHRFWSEGGWKTAGTLEQGDRLTLADGTGAVVTDITFEDRHTTVYNMEVADYHTYYVGEDSVWVHNMCGVNPDQPLNTGKSGTVGEGGSGTKLKWGNPKSKNTYGHTFIKHGKKVKTTQLIDRANGFNNPHQVGQWLDDQQAADFLSEVVGGGGKEGVFDVLLPSDIKARSIMPDGTELIPDRAKIVMYPNGSIETAYPYNSNYPTH